MTVELDSPPPSPSPPQLPPSSSRPSAPARSRARSPSSSENDDVWDAMGEEDSDMKSDLTLWRKWRRHTDAPAGAVYARGREAREYITAVLTQLDSYVGNKEGVVVTGTYVAKLRENVRVLDNALREFAHRLWDIEIGESRAYDVLREQKMWSRGKSTQTDVSTVNVESLSVASQTISGKSPRLIKRGVQTERGGMHDRGVNTEGEGMGTANAGVQTHGSGLTIGMGEISSTEEGGDTDGGSRNCRKRKLPATVPPHP